LKPSGLPIDEALPSLTAALRTRPAAVLQAPPGAGKSTIVPLALLQEEWVRGKRILMLEPRRLATRAVAQRMASLLGEPVGRTVGWRMRLDTQVSRDTRIEVVTEGVLTRMLQSDPALEGVAAVIFDEFHERSLQADLGLALALDVQTNLAPELRLLVMSATVDATAVAQRLGDAPIVSAAGRSFPVETRYAGRGSPGSPGAAQRADSLERSVAQAIRRALNEEAGDLLVFLPGVGEIRRVQGALARDGNLPNVHVLPLYGELDAAGQEAALAPAGRGERKIILATNIAETSLTIEGTRIVVDSGLVRRSVFDPRTGMSSLVTNAISRASADQRQGRAGRVAPGVCYRLWSEGGQRSLAAFSPPEILEADLSALALELAAWGIRDATQLRWLDAPPPSMLASARDLLARLGALDREGRITAHGREMAQLATHPRLAHLLLRARSLGQLPAALQLAGVLSERDLLAGSRERRDSDVRTRLELLRRGARDQPELRAAIERVQRTSRALARQLKLRDEPQAALCEGDIKSCGALLALAYPDRIAQRRAGKDARYLLANGRGAQLVEASSLGRSEYLVAVELDDSDRDARIQLAAPVDRADLERDFGAQLTLDRVVVWDEREQAVSARERRCLDALVLEDKPLRAVPADAVQSAMLEGVRSLGLAALPWDRDARDLQARIEFVRGLAGGGDPEWPAVDDASLGATLEVWLAPWLEGITRRDQLNRLNLSEALRSLLSFDQKRRLDELAPAQLTVPSGSRVRIDYVDDSAPVVSVRLQEVFGLAETPRIGGGRVPVTFKLLSPAQRPAQITRDLASFWRGAYADVRKDLRGRYPKHYWPENPLEAAPTRRAKPRS